jgi:hypothetical protein
MIATRLPINHYLHLREQGESHEKALTHTVQRYGVRMDDLLTELRQSRNHHRAVLGLLPSEDELITSPGSDA